MKIKNILAVIIMMSIISWYFIDITKEQTGLNEISFGEKFINDKPSNFPLLSFSLSVLFMLIGIFFGSFYSQIKDKDQISIRSEISLVISGAHLWKSFLIAPIIFIGIYMASDSYPDKILAALFAFQNGFFCETIMRKSVKEPR